MLEICPQRSCSQTLRSPRQPGVKSWGLFALLLFAPNAISQAGGPCGIGQVLLELQHQDQFGPVPGPLQPGVTLVVPKFDPSLGTLQGMQLRWSFRVLGELCGDNQGSTCGLFSDAQMQATASMIPAASNVPSVTGASVPPFLYVHAFTPPGFALGSADGTFDCITASGNPSIGDCTPGEDHFFTQYDTLNQWGWVSLTGVDLAPWIAMTPGESVAFEVTNSSANLVVNQGANVVVNFTNQIEVRMEVKYEYCSPNPQSVGTRYCFCDTGAPCGNESTGGEGCQNITGQGAYLEGLGSASLGAADLLLHGAQFPPNQPALFFQGDSRVNGGSGLVFGDGLRCAGVNVVRLEVQAASAGGEVTSSVSIGGAGGALAGEVKRYQVWYRDPAGSPCGSLYNLTNGLELQWQP
jgi:hypothetical protein